MHCPLHPFHHSSSQLALQELSCMPRENSIHLYLLYFLPGDPKALYMQSVYLTSSLKGCNLLLATWPLQLHAQEFRGDTERHLRSLWTRSSAFGNGLKTGVDIQDPSEYHGSLMSQNIIAPLQPAGMLLPCEYERHLENHYHFLQLPEGVHAGSMLEVSALTQSPSRMSWSCLAPSSGKSEHELI